MSYRIIILYKLNIQNKLVIVVCCRIYRNLNCFDFSQGCSLSSRQLPAMESGSFLLFRARLISIAEALKDYYCSSDHLIYYKKRFENFGWLNTLKNAFTVQLFDRFPGCMLFTGQSREAQIKKCLCLVGKSNIWSHLT